MTTRISTNAVTTRPATRADQPATAQPGTTPPASTGADASPVRASLHSSAVEKGQAPGQGLEDFSDATTPRSSATTENFDPAQRAMRKPLARGLGGEEPEAEARADRPTEDPVQVTSQINIRSNTRTPIGLGEPRERDNFQFRGASQDALEFPAQVGDHRFSIVVPAGPDAAEQARDIARSLSTLSPGALANVDRVVKNPVANPEDAYWAEQYNMPDFRSAMTAGRDGTITIYPHLDDRLDRVGPSLAHEVGHIASKRAWGENYQGRDWQRWAEAGAADGRSPSDYATRSRGEDFAETYALYVRSQGTAQHDRFREQFPNRFAIIDRMLGVTD